MLPTLILFLSSISCTFFRIKNGSIIDLENSNDPTIDWDLVSKSEVKWNGIWQHACTSALIQTWPSNTQPDPSLPAYVLTAGHCMAPFDEPNGKGKVFLDADQFPKSFISGFTFDSTSNEQKAWPLKIIRFATMNLTDLAIVELNVTARELISQGFNFYKLSTEEVRENASIEMVGYPGVGNGHRRYSKGIAIRQLPTDESWGHHLEMTWNVHVSFILFLLNQIRSIHLEVSLAALYLRRDQTVL